MKKISLAISLVFILNITVFAQKIDSYLYSSVTYNLQREITKALPEGIKAYHGPEFISLAKKGGIANVVIVKADKDEHNYLGSILQKELSKAWKVEIPLVDWE